MLETKDQIYQTKVVINAAGVHADEIHNMISERKMEITPRKGEYLLYDKNIGSLVSHTLFQLPTALGKGILVTPTVHGNLLTGPTALDGKDREGTDTTGEGISQVLKKAALSVSNIPERSVITSFAGLRAHITKLPDETETWVGVNGKEIEDDFVISEISDAPGFIDVAGIESPGLSCAPAVGEYVSEIVQKLLNPSLKKNFINNRKGIPSMSLSSDEERHRLIQQNPAYANVVCRCEMVTEGEILNAIHRTLGAATTDGIKRRTRAGMGRCQSGFCNPRVVEILARELGKEESEIRKSGEDSWYLLPSKRDQQK